MANARVVKDERMIKVRILGKGRAIDSFLFHVDTLALVRRVLRRVLHRSSVELMLKSHAP